MFSNTQYTFNKEVDGIIDEVEAAGIRWYLMAGNGVIAPFLAFELSGDQGVTAGAISGMNDLRRLFADDLELQEEMANYAISVGAAFSEITNDAPRWFGVSVQ